MNLYDSRYKLPTAVVMVVLTLLFITAVSGCGPQQLRDLEGVPQKEPEKAELYTNIDQYPNIVRICIDGVAFATTTRDYEPVMRVPEWDTTFCGAHR